MTSDSGAEKRTHPMLPCHPVSRRDGAERPPLPIRAFAISRMLNTWQLRRLGIGYTLAGTRRYLLLATAAVPYSRFQVAPAKHAAQKIWRQWRVSALLRLLHAACVAGWHL